MRKLRTLLVLVLLIAILAGGLHFWSRWMVLHNLEQARDAFARQDLKHAIATATTATQWSSNRTEQDEGRLILARSLITQRQLHPEIPQKISSASDPLVILERVQSRRFFPSARYSIADYLFFQSHRYIEGETAMQEGLLVDPANVDLLILRLQVYSLSGRKLEACEQIPVAQLETKSVAARRRYVRNLTQLAFFPDDFLLPLDRRLGLLAPEETTNPNTEMDRWFMLADGRHPAGQAAISQRYLDQGLRELAQEAIQAGLIESRKHPTGLFLEQWARLSQVHGTVDRVLLELLEKKATLGRQTHAKIYLEQADWEQCLNVWPLSIQEEALQRIIVHSPTEGKAAIDRLASWTNQESELRLVLLQSADETLDQRSWALVQKCWRAFGREDIANLVD